MSSLIEIVTVRGCSDAAIAPLVTLRRTRLSNLSLATNAVSVSVDMRGNETISVTALDPATMASRETIFAPGVHNAATNWYNDGMSVSNISHSAVVTAIERDALRRETARIDGRGSVSRTRYDAFGRVAATVDALTNATAYAYDAMGRLVSMRTAERRSGVLTASDENEFVWSYLPNSDLKASLLYPNGLTATWTYDANSQLLQVRNATPSAIISQYDYTYDAAGRRIARAHSGTAFTQSDTFNYAYNAKSELTNAVVVADANYTYAYGFDEIGNRRTSSECGVRSAEYAANELNQYTAISTDTSALFVSPRETFTPLFDADGNQTRVKTATGIWQVTYNGENRPILWERIEQPVLNSLGAYKGGRYSCLYKCGNFGLQSKDYYAPCKKIQLWGL